MKKLLKGNEAIAEAAIQAGCRFFFGYPITPQNQIPEYMSKRMPQVGGCFLQAESEVAAINMVYGAAGAGARVMTSSSSPGISLKQEGISYIVGKKQIALLTWENVPLVPGEQFDEFGKAGEASTTLKLLFPAAVGDHFYIHLHGDTVQPTR